MAKFEIFLPIKPEVITQPFGVNGAYYQTHGIQIDGHNGIDMLAYHGQPVYAAHDGDAYFEVDKDQGHGVVIRTHQVFDYEGDPRYTQTLFKTIYWHLCDGAKEPKFDSPIKATDLNGPGQPVKCGDIIGYADNTGFSAGDHLHFGLKAMVEGEAPGAYFNVEQNNGYLGAIDPAPYFNGMYAIDYKAEEAVVASAVSVVSAISQSSIPTEQKVGLLQKIGDLLKYLFGIQ